MSVPRCSWFYLQPPSDLHGCAHTARVMTWAAVLTRGTPWFEAVVWAAACHDLRRRDDGADPRHGFRAGSWVRKTLPGLLHRPPPELELIARACDWHVCRDARSAWDHPTLWLLKDADGLDRARLGDLDPSFLRSPEALRWVDGAHALYAATAAEDDPAAIWRVAGAAGLPVGELIEWAARQEANLLGSAEVPLPDARGGDAVTAAEWPNSAETARLPRLLGRRGTHRPGRRCAAACCRRLRHTHPDATRFARRRRSCRRLVTPRSSPCLGYRGHGGDCWRRPSLTSPTSSPGGPRTW